MESEGEGKEVNSMNEQFEYHTVEVKSGDLADGKMTPTFNEGGAQGWELVSAVQLMKGGGAGMRSGEVVCLFRRRKAA